MNQSAGAVQPTRRYSVDVGKDVAAIGADRNWKGIGISLLVILVVLSLIGLSIVLLSKDDASNTFGSKLTIDDLFQRNFQIHDPNAKWINEEEVIFRSQNGDVFKFNMNRNETDLLLRNTTFETFKASEFAVSPDLNYVLLAYDVKQVYQYSFLASYLIYNLHTREVRELNPPEVSDSILQFASWGVQGQQLLYIFENNIYYQADVQSSSWRLTSTGLEVVFNGIADWLYEEVLHTQVAHWWSPDGTRLAYLTINDTLVPKMLLPFFTGSLYPKGKTYPYPKMGQINPTVRVYIITLNGSSITIEARPPDSFENSEFYVTMLKWVSQDRLTVRWVNRAQNKSILSLCDAKTSSCVNKHVMTSERWIDQQNEEPVFSTDCNSFFITLPLKHGGRGTFYHITMISNQFEGQETNLRHLTSGSWEVTRILSYDEKINMVYFLSLEKGATQQHLYRVSTIDPIHKECLTCSLFKSKCAFYDAVLSPSSQHVLLSCRGPGIPKTTLHKLSDISDHKILDSNAELRRALNNRRMPQWERRTVQINNFELRLELIVPRDLDQTLEYPLLLLLESPPSGQAVSERFSLGWDSVLVSSESVIVARLDGRGSGFQGQRVLHEIHQRLGTVDVEDQIAAVKYLMRLPYIDRDRVAVYGKAYGGFLSSLMMLSHASVFKCGIAVAPITNWRLYGSAVSEKYFGFPVKEDWKYQLNTHSPDSLGFVPLISTWSFYTFCTPETLSESTPKKGRLPEKGGRRACFGQSKPAISTLLSNITAPFLLNFLIIHATADATVHFQHSAELVQLLSASNVNYSLQFWLTLQPSSEQSKRCQPFPGVTCL
ncbi:inactive dipeptidyl peptidase 10-like isoform X2 [Gouania willdenowi]|uniref:inactive dipeptidyl peptidase 10-like isoform X2 n=1 Tax=Gouania willdenowi TaxID=441366 RepID=UPI0010566EBA|nr:inactive dipeptidyl peptidase 10-like isoform X2 [Gouania willdenowi]